MDTSTVSGIEIPLEYRISHAHVGRGRIEAPDLVIHTHNPYWSYARHLPTDWDFSKARRRKSVASRLLDNLDRLEEDKEMDLSPLRDDQRVSGVVYGTNPLQSMFDLIRIHAHEFPEREFYAVWGGGRYEMPGKGFAIYVDNEKDANESMQALIAVAKAMQIPIEAFHRYGPVIFLDYVTIDGRLRSQVKDAKGFRKVLEDIREIPHFFHELFLTDRFLKKDI